MSRRPRLSGVTTPYDVLEVEPGASEEEVRRAYKRLTRRFDPRGIVAYGLYTTDELGDLARQLAEAYETLIARLKNPHDVYGLDPTSEIVMVMQSLNASTAADIDYRRLRNLLERSPKFSDDVNFRFDSEIKSKLEFAKNIRVEPASGDKDALLGRNVVGGWRCRMFDVG